MLNVKRYTELSSRENYIPPYQAGSWNRRYWTCVDPIAPLAIDYITPGQAKHLNSYRRGAITARDCGHSHWAQGKPIRKAELQAYTLQSATGDRPLYRWNVRNCNRHPGRR